MKICVAQTRPVKGNIKANISQHRELIALAVDGNSDIIIFPELSITGYEPELAKELAGTVDDSRLNEFQEISDTNNLVIGVGFPTNAREGIHISMIIFHPNKARQIYSKKYLHDDELPFFVSGQNESISINDNPAIGLAICYELSVIQHANDAVRNGARIYIASVAKSANGVEKSFVRLSEIARQYSMTVLFSNSVGPSDNFVGAGRSAAWDSKGQLLGSLDDNSEGILILDTDSGAVSQRSKVKTQNK